MKKKAVKQHTGGKSILHVRDTSGGFVKVHKTGRLGKNCIHFNLKKRLVICMVDGAIIHLFVQDIREKNYSYRNLNKYNELIIDYLQNMRKLVSVLMDNR